MFFITIHSLQPSVWALSSSPATKSSSSPPPQSLADYKANLRANIAHSVAKGERRAHERSANLRPVCRQCARPDALCVCDVMPPEQLATQTKILILQHPNERRKKNLSTVPLLKLSLQNVQVVVGYTFEPESLPPVQKLFEQGRKPLLLYPSEGAIPLDDASLTTNNQCSDDRPDNLIQSNDENLLIIVDGTWNEAKRMVRDSPRLVECCQAVQFTSEASSIYDAMRREPQEHCLSTLEACAQVLLLLEPQADQVQESLHRVLQAHVNAHLANARIMAAPRHVVYDKNKRRKEIELTLFDTVDDTSATGNERWKTKPVVDDVSSSQDFVWRRFPDGALIRSLRPEDATLVDSWWEYRSAKSRPLIHRRIRLDQQQQGGGCLGVEVHGKLVASVMKYEGGALGMLYVEEDFRRRGYARALLEQATSILELRGEERVAFIVDGNVASEAVFLAAGWERADPRKKRGTGKRKAKRKWVHNDTTTPTTAKDETVISDVDVPR